MILQALCEYYQRMAQDPESKIAPEGWEWKEIPFLVVISEQGQFVDFKDTREGEGRHRKAKEYLVPSLGEMKGSGIKANLLWENLEYILGIAREESKSPRVEQQHKAFIEKAAALGKKGLDHPAYDAVIRFLYSKENVQATKSGHWQVVKTEGTIFTFDVEGYGVVTDVAEVRTSVDDMNRCRQADGICLVTGAPTRVASLHPPIKGVKGTKTSAGALISFNLPAFTSYGKQQNRNAPVGEILARQYTGALNWLLRQESANKATASDMTVVFWAEKPSNGYDLESVMSWYFSDPTKDDPDRGVRAVKSLFTAVQSGKLPGSDASRFYVLGLSPNSARIAVRLWKVGTVRDLAEKIKLHIDDLKIVRGPKDSEYLSLNQLLKATALQYKSENIPPNLAGAMIESVLDGTPYPRTLLQQCMRRVRAERNVTHPRAAILRAYVNRLNRFYGKTNEEEICMALDRKRTDTGYRMGRLFGVLDKIQEEANPGINATIRDRFYGAASSSPVSVFSQLLKLKNHHLSKLGQGRRMYFEKEITEIMSELSDFPPHLSLDEQARFAIGYYHQRQSFFERKNQEPKEETK